MATSNIITIKNFAPPKKSFQRYVPTDTAIEITPVLIRHFNQTYCGLTKNTNFLKICQKVAPFGLKSVLHPSLNDLDAIPAIAHSSLMEY
jgi:hypothetical protein